MDNPFLNNSLLPDGSQYLTPVCSINRVRLAKLPVYGVDDSIEGLTVKEFFRVKLIIEEIKRNASALGIDLSKTDEKQLPRKLPDIAHGKDEEKASLARAVMTKFGDRLGLLLLALRIGDEENRKARSDWNDAHWEYWKRVKDVVLVGGLASGMFGSILADRVKAVFAMREMQPYNILLYDNASEAAITGCAGCIKGRGGVYVVMDFGQTGIKRSCVLKEDGEIAKIAALESMPSKYMDWDITDEKEKRRQAKELHLYLVSAICSAWSEAKRIFKEEPGGEIVISIASYIKEGALNTERSGYAKLCVLGEKYEEVLSWELSGRLRREISVKLIHDGTAFALNFRDRKNTVCLALGSYFGIGFPETEVNGIKE